MRPLLMDDEQKQKIAKVVAYAEAHPYSRPYMQERVALAGLKQDVAPGDDPNFRCEIPFGFKCVFTIEEQPVGWCRHLSVSVDNPTKVPSIPAVEMLMKEFGFKGPLKECYVYMEEDISPKAVNIIEKK